MELEWDYVKKRTLWPYEKLIAKLLDVLAYPFVQEYYAHDMHEASLYAEQIRLGYRQNEREAEFIYEIEAQFRCLSSLGVGGYGDLVERVKTRSSCERFIQETGLAFGALIDLLNFLFRWVLPFRIPVKELVDTMPGAPASMLELLKTHHVRSNLDALESFRRRPGRLLFAAETGLDPAVLLALAHRADMSRLAFVRGKSVMHLCGAGYDTLEKLAAAQLPQMAADMAAYYASLGKTFADFKSVIPLDWMVGGARLLPKLMEPGE